VQLSVTQIASIVVPMLQTDSTHITLKGRTGTTDSFIIKSTVSWIAASSASWIRLSQTTGMGDAKIIVTVTRNNSTSVDWSEAILISSSSSPTLQPVQVVVTAKPYSPLEKIWDKTYDINETEAFSTVINTSDGGFVMAGYTGKHISNYGIEEIQRDCWAQKVDSAGVVVWQKILGGSKEERFTSVTEADDGGFVFCGFTASSDGDITNLHGQKDVCLVKLSGSGNLLWQTTIGGTGEDMAYSVAKTSNGDFMLVGETSSINGDLTGNHGKSDLLIAKVGRNGNKIWTRTYGGSGDDVCTKLIATSDQSFLLIGNTSSPDGDVAGEAYNNRSWIIKCDGNGSILWQKKANFSAFSTIWITAVVEYNGSYFFWGNHNQANNWPLAWIQFDQQGNLVKKNETTLPYFYVEDVLVDPIRGEFILCTPSQFVNAGRICKLDQQGNLLWNEWFVRPNTHFTSIVQKSGFLVAAGYTYAGYRSANGFLMKMKPDQ
jgi:hypothetical protein